MLSAIASVAPMPKAKALKLAPPVMPMRGVREERTVLEVVVLMVISGWGCVCQ